MLFRYVTILVLNTVNLLNRTMEKLDGSKIVTGEVAWRLDDTCGFPIDLTQFILVDIV